METGSHNVRYGVFLAFRRRSNTKRFILGYCTVLYTVYESGLRFEV
jgi:hypothetical protein